MKDNEIKTIWKLAKIFWINSTLLWILETIFFLIYEGWHIQPTNKIEIYLDSIVSSMWNYACISTVFCAIYSLINLTNTKQ